MRLPAFRPASLDPRSQTSTLSSFGSTRGPHSLHSIAGRAAMNADSSRPPRATLATLSVDQAGVDRLAAGCRPVPHRLNCAGSPSKPRPPTWKRFVPKDNPMFIGGPKLLRAVGRRTSNGSNDSARSRLQRLPRPSIGSSNNPLPGVEQQFQALREAFEERAASMEYDGRLSRGEAVRGAWGLSRSDDCRIEDHDMARMKPSYIKAPSRSGAWRRCSKSCRWNNRDQGNRGGELLDISSCRAGVESVRTDITPPAGPLPS